EPAEGRRESEQRSDGARSSWRPLPKDRPPETRCCKLGARASRMEQDGFSRSRAERRSVRAEETRCRPREAGAGKHAHREVVCKLKEHRLRPVLFCLEVARPERQVQLKKFSTSLKVFVRL